MVIIMKDKTMFERLMALHFEKDIGIYYCGKRINTLGHTYGPEIKNHYIFVLVNKGKAVMLPHKKIRFGEHDLLIMFPDEKIHYRALEAWSISWLGLYGEAVSDFMDLLGATPQKPIIKISLYNELKAVMDNIYDASKDTSLSSKLSIIGLTYEFFAILLKNARLDRKTDLISASLKIIDYNFCSNVSIEKIAESLHVDSAYFSRKFTEKMQLSPKEYILNKRIERAKELLCTTDANIFEISNSVGYEDQFYFCRIFKKYTSLSPSEYRKFIKEKMPAYIE